MGQFSDIFNEVYTAEAQKLSTLYTEDSHKEQLDILKELVTELNEAGHFSAEVTELVASVPVLKVEPKGAEGGQTFFLEQVFNAAQAPALRLSTGLARTVLAGREAGYDLRDKQALEQMVRDIGQDLARKAAYHKRGAEMAAYLQDSPKV